MKWLFSKLLPRKRETAPEVERLIRLFEDGAFQASLVPSVVREKFINGPSVDEVPNAFGEFGLTLTNPIPVNGSLGELIYLSSLQYGGRTKILFHRLGSFNAIDIYETVTVDGSEWSILYFDCYHARRSRKSPKGYSLVRGDRSSYGLYGVNHLVPNFPAGLTNGVSAFTTRILGRPMTPHALKDAEATIRFVRPKDHLRRRDEIEIEAARRPGTYSEVAEIILGLALREADGMFPAYREEIGKFLRERGMLNGIRLAVYEHPSLKVAFTACIAATWYCSVLATFGSYDAGILANELRHKIKSVAEGPMQDLFEDIFNSALKAAAPSLQASAAGGTPTPAFGIADVLMSSVALPDDPAEPVDDKLREDLILRFHEPFHHRSDEVFELGIKYALEGEKPVTHS